MRVIVVSSLEDAFTSVTVPVIVLPSATERAEMIKEDKAGAAGPRCCVSIRRRTRSPRIQCSRCRYGWLDCHRLNGRIVARDHPSRSAAKTIARRVDPRTPIPTDNCQVVRGPAADITVVVAGRVDLDRISRGSCVYRAAGRQILLPRAYSEYGCTSTNAKHQKCANTMRETYRTSEAVSTPPETSLHS